MKTFGFILILALAFVANAFSVDVAEMRRSQIELGDWQQGRQMAWHGLTQVDSNLSTATSKFSQYEIELVPLFARGIDSGLVQVGFTDIPECIGDGFNPISRPVFLNRELIDVVSELEANGATLESAGTLNGRSQRFLSFGLGADFEVAGRKHIPYLNLLDSVDGSFVLSCFVSVVCVVCWNTYRASLRDAKGKPFNVRVKHTKNARAKLEKIPELIEAFFETSKAYEKQIDEWSRLLFAQADARAMLAGWQAGSILSVEDASLLSRRAINTVDRMVSLFEHGRGNVGQNGADLFSAVTDYYSHESAGLPDVRATAIERERVNWKQFASSEFGSGANAKNEFARLLGTVTPDQIPQIRATGEEILYRSERELVAAAEGRKFRATSR